MKKKLKLIALLTLIGLCMISPVIAADSTGTPSGIAKQPDINQRGSNIIEVGNLETSSIDADSATVTGAMSAGSLSTGTVSASSVSTSGTVSAGTVSAPTGAITSLNTNRTYVQRTPTADVDATNKKYVDGQYAALASQVSAVANSAGGQRAPSYTKRVGYNNVYQNCPSGYALIVSSLHSGVRGASNGNYYIHKGFCVKTSYIRDANVVYVRDSPKQYNGGYR